jgi:hypothetical protein
MVVKIRVREMKSEWMEMAIRMKDEVRLENLIRYVEEQLMLEELGCKERWVEEKKRVKLLSVIFATLTMMLIAKKGEGSVKYHVDTTPKWKWKYVKNVLKHLVFSSRRRITRTKEGWGRMKKRKSVKGKGRAVKPGVALYSCKKCGAKLSYQEWLHGRLCDVCEKKRWGRAMSKKRLNIAEYESRNIEKAMLAFGCGALVDQIKKDTEDSMRDSAQHKSPNAQHKSHGRRKGEVDDKSKMWVRENIRTPPLGILWEWGRLCAWTVFYLSSL